MDERALTQLPATYAAYLRLAGAGLEADEIARRLEVDPTALPLLARLAEAKLAAVTAASGGDEVDRRLAGPEAALDTP